MILQYIKEKKVSITMMLAISIFVIISILGMVQYVYLKVSLNNTIELITYKTDGIISGIEDSTMQHLKPARMMVEHLAKEMVNEEEILPAKRLKDLFTGGLIDYKYLGSINYFKEDFTAFGVVSKEDGSTVLSPISSLSADKIKANKDLQRLHKANRKASSFIWNQPEFFANRGFLVGTVPIWINGEYRGFLSITVETKALSKMMIEVGERFDATAFMLYGDEHVLAHKELVLSHPKQTTANPLVQHHHLKDNFLTHEWEDVVDGFFISKYLNTLKEQNISIKIKDIDGKRYALLTKPIGGFGAKKIIIGAWFDARLIFEPANHFFIALAVGFGLLLLAVLFAYKVGKSITTPVKLSARAASQLQSFEIDQVKPLPPSIYEELNEQSNAFNNMLDGLNTFSQYVPKKLVNELIKNNENITNISYEKKLTIMFTDIVGFTSLSEKLNAHEVAQFLNEHFKLLGKEVERSGGTIDKFIGDALMAFWGAPQNLEDSAAKACEAALSIREKIKEYNEDLKAKGKEPVRVRIGIHTGDVVVGTIGSHDRISYTIVGDNVNSTQRLESLGRDYQDDNVTILVSQDTLKDVNITLDTKHLGDIQVKGRTKPLDVYKIV